MASAPDIWRTWSPRAPRKSSWSCCETYPPPSRAARMKLATSLGRQVVGCTHRHHTRDNQAAGHRKCDDVARGTPIGVDRRHHDRACRSLQPWLTHRKGSRTDLSRNQLHGGGHMHEGEEDGHVEGAHMEVPRSHRRRRADHRSVVPQRRRKALQLQCSSKRRRTEGSTNAADRNTAPGRTRCAVARQRRRPRRGVRDDEIADDEARRPSAHPREAPQPAERSNNGTWRV